MISGEWVALGDSLGDVGLVPNDLSLIFHSWPPLDNKT